MKLLTGAVMLAAVFSMGAQAGLTNTSLFTEGDKGATLHVETGLEWLKLDYTKGLSYNEVLSEMGNGGMFDGWRFPSYDEALVYTEEALSRVDGLTFGDRSDSVSKPHVNEAYTVFRNIGFTDGSLTSNGAKESVGLYYDNSGTLRSVEAYVNGIHTYSGYIRYNSSRSQDKDTSYAKYGFLLVSDGGTTLTSINDPTINANNPDAPINDVPIPLVGSLGALMLIGMRRKRVA